MGGHEECPIDPLSVDEREVWLHVFAGNAQHAENHVGHECSQDNNVNDNGFGGASFTMVGKKPMRQNFRVSLFDYPSKELQFSSECI